MAWQLSFDSMMGFTGATACIACGGMFYFDQFQDFPSDFQTFVCDVCQKEQEEIVDEIVSTQ